MNTGRAIGKGISTIGIWAGVIGVCFVAQWAAGYAILGGVFSTFFVWRLG